jgi:hypothetical protein
VQADSIVPEPGNPQSWNRYAYVLNNSLRYKDPSGHFSEEQLEWLGVSTEGLTAEQKLLLWAASPWEVIQHGEKYYWLKLRENRKPDNTFGLELVVSNDTVAIPINEWFNETGDSYTLWRNTPDGWVTVFEDGWFAGNWQHMAGQSGHVVGEREASWNRFFGSIGGETIEEGLASVVDAFGKKVPFLGLGLGVVEAAFYPGALPAGHQAGDVTMSFYYAVRDGIWIQEFWFRPGARGHIVIDYSWQFYSVSPLSFCEVPQTSWWDNYYSVQ